MLGICSVGVERVVAGAERCVVGAGERVCGEDAGCVVARCVGGGDVRWVAGGALVSGAARVAAFTGAGAASTGAGAAAEAS